MRGAKLCSLDGIAKLYRGGRGEVDRGAMYINIVLIYMVLLLLILSSSEGGGEREKLRFSLSPLHFPREEVILLGSGYRRQGRLYVQGTWQPCTYSRRGRLYVQGCRVRRCSRAVFSASSARGVWKR